jgi:hypothetical protein
MTPSASDFLNFPLYSLFNQIYDILVYFSFLWGPLIAIMIAQKLWLSYVRLQFITTSFKFVLLEIKLPRVIDKTPMAMELVLQSLHQGGMGNWFEKWWKGKVSPWFSLEIISREGEVKFFIRTPVKFKTLIESHIYAQYPDIEVIESEDYISAAPYIHEKEKWSMWGCEFGLTKPDPYPIKTYVDYGLDKLGTKEEFKSDPITSMIEFLGSVGRGEQIWFQILVRANIARYHTHGTWFGEHNWKDEGTRIVKEFNKKNSAEGAPKPSKNDMEAIAALERSLGKIGFDCGIRALYIADNEHYNPANIAGLTGAFRQYSSPTLNGFKPQNTVGFDYPWQDYFGSKEKKQKHKIFDAYVRRSYFYAPYKRKPFVLNSEELATIFHFPGGVAETPTFNRIESRKGEPPANLPI